VENNLYGLDIDDRAGQLAYFSVMMEARKYNRRALNGDLEPKVMAIEETKFMTGEMISYVANGDKALQEDLTYLKTVFDDGKEYGSILTVKSLDFVRIYSRLSELETVVPENLLDQLVHDQALSHLKPIIMQAEILSGKFDAVITNPPYMGGSGMDARLSKYVKDHYPDSKSDLFAVFIERCKGMTAVNRYQAMITQHAWMFLSSYEKLRGKLLNVDTINMAHLGARAFEEIGGEVVQTTSFVMQKRQIKGFKGTYCRLIEPTTQQGKEDMFLAGENRYESQQANFAKIPGSPVAYWVGEDKVKYFVHNMEAVLNCKTGLICGNNEKYIRHWYEVKDDKICLNCMSLGDGSIENVNKWFPYNHGGERRRWYGNHNDVVNLQNSGESIKKEKGAMMRNSDFYFKSGITWNRVGSGKKFAAREALEGFVFDDVSPSGFLYDKMYYSILGYMNSKVFQEYLQIFCTALKTEIGHIQKVLYLMSKHELTNKVVKNSVDLLKTDWDSYETSWDFKKHPLV